MKKWEILPQISENFKNQFPEINPVVSQLLYNRNLKTQEEIDEFLNPDWGQDIHDPFLFRDMEKAVSRIFQAIKNKEKITIYGDYDADGVTASALLYLVFKKLRLDQVDVYLPHREKEGYGMNKESIREIARAGTKLIITVDNGIVAWKEIDSACHLGMDVIVTDHHLEGKKLPKAMAIINPKVMKETYPFRYLAGAGVAFKLAQALLSQQPAVSSQHSAGSWESKAGSRANEAFEKWLLDLVAIGTVADSMPLLGENRTLVKYGLVVLNKTARIGLRALFNQARLELGTLDTRNISYQIAPRINAAGRMDHASTAYELLITESQEEAEGLAKNLENNNQERQKMIDKICRDLEKDSALGEKEIIAVLAGDWPVGILGLIAGRLVDRFNRPALAVTRYNGKVKGSGRSIVGLDLLEILREKEMEKYFADIGGHQEACGFTLKSKEVAGEFLMALTSLAHKKLSNYEFRPKLLIDEQLDVNEFNWTLWEELEKFEPFGIGNPRPKFLASNLNLDEIQPVGANGNHLRIYADARKMIYFRGANNDLKLKEGDKVDIVFEPGINEWNGTRELQLKIIDIKKHT